MRSKNSNQLISLDDASSNHPDLCTQIVVSVPPGLEWAERLSLRIMGGIGVIRKSDDWRLIVESEATLIERHESGDRSRRLDLGTITELTTTASQLFRIFESRLPCTTNDLIQQLVHPILASYRSRQLSGLQ